MSSDDEGPLLGDDGETSANELSDMNDSLSYSTPHKQPKSVSTPKAGACKTVLFSILSFLTSNYLNILLVCVPFAPLSVFAPWYFSLHKFVNFFKAAHCYFFPFFFTSFALDLANWLLGQITKYFCRDDNPTLCTKVFLSLLQMFLGNISEVVLGCFLIYHKELLMCKSLMIGSLICRLILSPSLSILIANTKPKSYPTNNQLLDNQHQLHEEDDVEEDDHLFEKGELSKGGGEDSSLNPQLRFAGVPTNLQTDQDDDDDDEKGTYKKPKSRPLSPPTKRVKYESLSMLREGNTSGASSSYSLSDDNYINSVHGYAHTTMVMLSILLLITVIPIIIPSLLAIGDNGSVEGLVRLSRWVSGCLFLLGGGSFSFLLVKKWDRYAKLDDQQFSEQLKAGPVTCLFLMLLCLLSLGFSAYGVSSTISGVSLTWGFTRTFTGAVLLPTATQASTHVTSSRQTLNLSLYFTMCSVHVRLLCMVLIGIPLQIYFSMILMSFTGGQHLPGDALGLDFGVVLIVVLLLAVILHVFLGIAGQHLSTPDRSGSSDSPEDDDEEDSLGGSSTRQRHGEKARKFTWPVGALMLVLYLIVVIVLFYHP